MCSKRGHRFEGQIHGVEPSLRISHGSSRDIGHIRILGDPILPNITRLERSQCDIEPDVPPVTKAVGDRLRGGSELHLHPFDHARVDAVAEGLTACPDDLQCRRGEQWLAGVATDQHPDCVGHLGSHAVHLQRAEQTNHGVWDALADFGEPAQLGRGRVGEPVEATADLLEHATAGKPLEISAGNSSSVEVTGPEGTAPRPPQKQVDPVRRNGGRVTKRCPPEFWTDYLYQR